jgi:hypothetical protein
MVTQAYLSRVAALLGMIEPNGSVDPVAKAQVIGTIKRVLEVSELYPGFVDGNNGNERIEEQSESILREFPALALGGDELPLLDWARRFNEVVRRLVLDFVTAVERIEPEANDELLQIARGYLALLETENQAAAAVEEALVFRSKAQRSAEAAEEAAMAARASAGITADARLGEYFETYAKSELRTSAWFRGFTIGALAGTVILALTLPHGSAADLSTVIYRAVGVVGAAGFAAYLGRQAGQHRKNGNWARSLEIQLKSFDAFIAPVNDSSSRAIIYQQFATRVLGPPPASSSSGAPRDAGNVDTRLVEALTALARGRE